MAGQKEKIKSIFINLTEIAIGKEKDSKTYTKTKYIEIAKKTSKKKKE